MPVNRNYGLTEYVLNENDCTRRRPEFPGRNVVFNKTIAGRRRTLLLNVKPARMSVKTQ